VAELIDEFQDVRNKTVPRWFRERDVVTPATTPVVRVKFGEILKIDTTSADVPIYLPQATPNDLFRTVAFIKTSSSNNVNVNVVGSGVTIHGSTTLAVSQIGLHYLIWDGLAWWRQSG
jgi:hypothetical protein